MENAPYPLWQGGQDFWAGRTGIFPPPSCRNLSPRAVAAPIWELLVPSRHPTATPMRRMPDGRWTARRLLGVQGGFAGDHFFQDSLARFAELLLKLPAHPLPTLPPCDVWVVDWPESCAGTP